MPMSICPSCERRRPVADYIAKLPLRCTGCGHALSIAADDEPAEVIPLEAVASKNGTPDSVAELPDLGGRASLAYVGLSNAELSDILDTESNVTHPTEFAPSSSDFAIAITPDRELAPLVVSEKLSVSSFQLPSSSPGQSVADESEKSKLAGFLKEITSLSSARPVEVPPAPQMKFAPLPPAKPASPLRKFWNRLTRR